MMPLFKQDADPDVDELERMAEQRCMKENFEFTSLRRRVFREIALRGGAIGAYDIASYISTEGRRVNAASVYRALDFLVESGLVRRIKSSRAFALADLTAQPKRDETSISFVCRKSGTVREIQSPLVAMILQEAGKSVGFKDLSTLIEVEGVFAPAELG
ncbi:Fur family transcriptional regulator [Microvirga lotononidis]|uniref:Fe2+/Zn2+ uptake regulation protein n=1 Tax=Microvirga lotononidis TaxID=864069 RepID=I4YXG7_9HYPH|nr:transcriptional repressor [Microvirga lotononidis]EIM28659.1 Fe2+/Zn2+ uptake regulation protein [Microvirga lotononidis]WQO25598.1 transcriptional repressor [Microvirga lotononidis]